MDLKKLYFSEKITNEERKILKIYFQEKELYQQNKSKILSLYDTLLQFLKTYLTGLLLSNETTNKKKNKIKMNDYTQIDLLSQNFQVNFKPGTAKNFKNILINEDPFFIEDFLYKNFKLLFNIKKSIESIGDYEWKHFLEYNFQKRFKIDLGERFQDYDNVIYDLMDKIAKEYITKTESSHSNIEIIKELNQKRLLFIEKKVFIDQTSIDKVPKKKINEFEDFRWNKMLELISYDQEKPKPIENQVEPTKETREFSFIKSLERCFENLYLYSNSKSYCNLIDINI